MITAECVSGIYICISCIQQSGRLESVTADVLDQGVGVGGAVSKTFGCKSVDDDW